jgi:hypothetical protein
LRQEFGRAQQPGGLAGGRMGDRRTDGTDGLPPGAQGWVRETRSVSAVGCS